MENCIFCKIIRKELPAHIIYEDEEFIAFLDAFPNTKGMTLVIPKKHYPSYAFDMPEDVYQKLMSVSKKVGKKLEKGLPVKRVAMVMEGMGIDHVHIKLYPLHGLKEKFEETFTKKEIFFDKYEGYTTTLLGPKAEDEELKKIADKIEQASKT